MRDWQTESEMHRLNWLVQAANLEVKLRRFMQATLAKFDPNQPRVPAGNSTGGQWTDGGGAAESNVGVADSGSPRSGAAVFERIFSTARKLRLAGDASYQRCLDLCYPILERPIDPRSDRNTWDFHKCMNQCLGRNL
jgi:hypothetical protein